MSDFAFTGQCHVNFRAPQSEKQSHMLDLLDVNLGEASGSSVQTDPWGIPITAPPPRPQVFANCVIHFRSLHDNTKSFLHDALQSLDLSDFHVYKVCQRTLNL